MQDRYFCKNPHCCLQGLRTKYICRLCVNHQIEYFADLKVDYRNVLGDVNDPEWYCPTCVIWEDDSLPLPGLCCCTFRHYSVICPVHEGSCKHKRNGKTNFHCKPYKQKIIKPNHLKKNKKK